eukprot:TRINITY_DN98924_c0_g1_i1.p1 TRINITY_DN98924_c0_g1~~TRINITY_DN98924_c0_g1_i1.p1  ORF type:complete len:236 (+),score=40.38 TRINITY_DN98924_c0_g1_i1:34-741(+)
MVKEATIPPYDDWAKEAERTLWFGKWRDPKTQLGYGFLYEDGKARPEYPRKDNWCDKDFPVDYDSSWARGKRKWEVWLDALDAWDHERKRLCEVYTRQAETLSHEEALALWEGKFPRPPLMPQITLAVFQAAFDGDVVRLAEALESSDADPCCRDHNLQTPLMFAAVAGSLDCVEYLVDVGADCACMDNQQDTAFDIAIAEHGERFPEHPVILFFKSVQAPRGKGIRSSKMTQLS